MTVRDEERSLDEAAGLHDGLAHPARVAVLRALRETPKLAVAELRHRLEAVDEAMDTRTLQHHLYKMQVAGLVVVRKDRGREVVRLLRDVRLSVRPLPEPSG